MHLAASCMLPDKISEISHEHLFFFQAEDGIRDYKVTGVQTCALPIFPNGMDGVGGVTQPHIDPGKTFVYEFVLTKSGTFMYHPHSDEMVQMAMGMMGKIGRASCRERV